MSSFDPDDTTPLINPLDNTQNNASHGTFNESQDDDEPLDASSVQSNEQDQSDDEMLDTPQVPNGMSNQRFNPFNRVPNLPPQLADELAATIEEPQVSMWGRFKR